MKIHEWDALGPAEPGLYLNMSHRDYCSDPCPLPSISSSLVSTILDRSPMHARHEHPRLAGAAQVGDAEDETSEPMDRGSIIDALIFGNGPEIVPIAADSFRTKLAKEARDAARSRGSIPVIADKLAMYRAVSEAIKTRIGDAGIDLSEGVSQVTMLWQIGDVWCRGRLDHFFPEQGVVLDLKTTVDASPGSVEAKVNDGYDVQHAAYVGPQGGLTTLAPELAGRLSMRFVFVEVSRPFGLFDGEPDAELAELGARRWREAIQVWGECQRSGIYPGYPRGPQRIKAKAWRMAADMNRQVEKLATQTREDSIPF